MPASGRVAADVTQQIGRRGTALQIRNLTSHAGARRHVILQTVPPHTVVVCQVNRMPIGVATATIRCDS